MHPFGSLLARGLEVGAGSDSPITPLDHMYGVWAMETHHSAAERLGREEAVRLFTWGGARLAHLEGKKGQLRSGMHADFAAYDRDPLMVDDPREIRPVLTVSRGREVFVR